MKLFALFSRQRGSALPMAMVVLAVFSVLGVTMAKYVTHEVKTARQTENYLQARYLAEAGVEDAFFRMKKNLTNNGRSFADDFLDFRTDALPTGITKPTAPTDFTNVAVGASAYGSYKWEYDNTNPDNLDTKYWWECNTVLPPVKSEITNFPTLGSQVVEVIRFHRTIIGTGRVILPDGTTYVRKVRVGAYLSFRTAEVPDSPVLVTITRWEDYN